MNLYQLTLAVHNINRWLILVFVAMTIINSVIGVKKKRFSRADGHIHSLTLTVCYLQLGLGLILYSLSPVVNGAFEMGIKKAMNHSELRFYAIEHVLFMFIAIMLIHVGCALSKKQQNPIQKHRKVLFFFSVAVLLILIRIPWQRVLWPI